jgi:NAD(P)-dependent dehydrogenase (short-subunit alcohol dehydrogenase family)
MVLLMKNNSKRPKKMNKKMIGKICLITGANSGIGKALALALSGYGAHLILVCRDPARGKSALKEIKEKTGNPHIDLFIIDVSSQQSIRNGVCEIKKKYKKLDVFINNAGVLLFKKIVTEDGIEKMFATNYLGPFLLTNLLKDLLIAGAPSRIVNVVSEGTSKYEIDVDNLMAEKKYNPLKIYSQSKQAEILFTYELASRLKKEKITANCYYPGLVSTHLGKAEKGFRRITFKIFTKLLKFLFIPMKESIKIGLYLALSNKAMKLTGKFLKREKDKIIVKSLYNKDTSKKLWLMSEKLTGL